MLASLQQRKRANSLAAERTSGVPAIEVTLQDSGTALLPGFTPDGIYSGDSHLDPLYPSWLTDFQFDGTFLSSGFGSHFG